MQDNRFNHMMLARLKGDCEYFLNFGNGHEKHLWAGNVHGQIKEMKRIYNLLPIKPIWLKEKQIKKYQIKMVRKLLRSA